MKTNEDKGSFLADNVLPFVRPNPEEGTPDDLNWLKRLGVGSIFMCQRKNQGADFSIGCFAVQSISEKQVYGLVNLQDNQACLVNPVRFCNVFEQVEVLRSRQEYLAEKDLNNERDRTNSVLRLENDETTSVGREPDEEGEPGGLQGSNPERD